MREAPRSQGQGVQEVHSKLPSRPFTVCVEGNIGSGKSTFLEHFRQFPCVAVLEEPVQSWRDLRGHNMLQQMYEDPVR